MMRVGSRTLAGVVMALSMVGCGRDASFSSLNAPSLRIEPGSRTLFANQVFGFTVLRTEDGLTTDITQDPDLVLSVTVPDVVDVERGQGQAVGVGATELVAELGGSTARVRLEVLADQLVGLQVEPRSIRLAVGAEVQLEVTGQLSSGATVDLSAGSEGTVYSSSGPAASVSTDGLVRGVLPGDAELGITQVGQQDSVAVEVVSLPDNLASIRLEPDPLFLQPGEERRVRLIGIDGEGNELVLPVSESSFETSDRSLARVDSLGNVRALNQEGETNLTARFRAFTTVGTIRIERPEARLLSLSLSPDGGEIEVAQRVNLVLVASFDDGSARDVATEAGSNFSSDNDNLSVSDDGLLIGNRPGQATVTAIFGGLQVQAVFQVVGNLSVSRLEVAPTPIALEVGAELTLTVTAFFSDGSQDDVTELTTLSPPNNAVRWEPGPRTLFGVQEGAGTLNFGFGGVTTSVPFAVIEDFEAVELFFEPDPLELEPGQSQSFQLFARLPSGDTVDVTNFPGVDYEVVNEMVASLEAPPVAEVRGLEVGVTELIASFQGISVSARIVVVPDSTQVVSLIISSPTVIPLNQPFQVQVIGILADGNSVLLNGDSELSVTGTPSSIVVITQSGANIELRGANAGTGDIEARFRGLTASRQVRVLPGADPVTSIFFDPASLTLDAGQVGTTFLRARRASGAEFIVGPNAGAALVPDLGIAASQVSTSGINVSGFVAGSFQLRAFFQGLSTILPVEIIDTSMITALQIVTLDTLDLNEAADIQVFGITADGLTLELTDDPGLVLLSEDPAVAMISGTSWEAVGSGTTVLVARFGDLEAATDVTVNEPRTPTLTGLSPDILEIQDPNGPDRQVEVRGTNLLPGDTILVDGSPVTVVRQRPGLLIVRIPGSLLESRSTLEVQAQTPLGALSNVLDLEVANPPAIDRGYPSAAIRGGLVRIRLFGANLEEASVTGPTGVTVSNVDAAPSGDELSFDALIPRNQAAGNVSFSIETPGGSTTRVLEVETSAPSLTISGNRAENGSLLVDDLTITSSGRLSGNGPQSPIVIIASGDVVIDGEITVSGDSGKAGTTPSGGAGGPGGAGGGGGGSALNPTAALGGAGQPSGAPAANPAGIGTSGGDGGGEGGGDGAPTSTAVPCGASGGGGAGAGATADGGDGRFGGASGGAAPGLSFWKAGAGGGGGNSCGGTPGSEPDTAGSGGGGGGLIEIQLTHGGRLTINGDIFALGGDGGDGSPRASNSNGGGAGGGGGGGVIRLISNGGAITIGSGGSLDVRGGDGGRLFSLNFRTGGGGGGGIVLLEPRGGALTLTGPAQTQGGMGGTMAQNGGAGTLSIQP
ncbi:MAG: Ig-like domain-containing protein [Myxococcota bacterium]